MRKIRTASIAQKSEYGIKFDQALSELRDVLKSGRFLPGAQLPAEAELFRELKVGRQTLLRALDVLVKEGVIVRRRGSGTYVSEQNCPPLIPGRYLRFGVLWHNSVQRERLHGTFSGCMTMGALTQWCLQDSPARFPEVTSRETTRGIWIHPRRGVTVEAIGEPLSVGHRRPDLVEVRDGNFDGVLALGIVDEAWLSRLLELNIPTVIVDNSTEVFSGKVDMVFVDSQPGYRQAVSILVARGARRIHFAGDLITVDAQPETLAAEALEAWRLSHRKQEPDSLLRQHAWQIAMEKESLAVNPGWIHLACHGRHHWLPLINALADLPSNERPEAMVCSSQETAEVFQEVFASRGLPLLVAGATNDDYAGPCLPIRLDGKHLGATGAALLLNRIQQRNSPYMRVGVAMQCLAKKPEPIKIA